MSVKQLCCPRLFRKEALEVLNAEHPMERIREILEKGEDHEPEAHELIEKLVNLLCKTYSFKLLLELGPELNYEPETIKKHLRLILWAFAKEPLLTNKLQIEYTPLD